MRARGPGAGSVDAIEPSDDREGPVAALQRQRTAALGVVAAQTLSRAEEAFTAVLGPPAAGPLTHPPTCRRLVWVLARLDRYGDRGAGEAGAGLSMLEQLLDGQDWSIRREGAAVPAHLAYFLPALEHVARRWKHTWAPPIKAERKARGARRASDPLNLKGVLRSTAHREAQLKAFPAGAPLRRRGKKRQAAS